mgnify:CR=1 FL=1
MKKSHGVIVALFAAVALLSCKVDSSSGGGGNDKVASAPVITEQPQAATYQKDADKVNFLKINVQELTDGGTLSYQWYKDGTPIKGAIKNSVEPDVSAVGKFVYYCAVTNTLGKSTASTESERVTISVISVNQNVEKTYAAAPLITENPVNATYKSGADVSALKVTAEVKAEGNALKGDVKYQWYKDGEKIASATSASYQPFATAPEVSDVKEYKYYCEVTNDCTATATGDIKTASAKSAEVTITVEPKGNSKTYAAVPSITANPDNATYKSGADVSALNVTAEVKAEGNALKGDVKYQWYEDGEKIASATSASYQPFATAPEVGEVKEYKYYCEVTNDCTATATGDKKTASAKSAEVTITVEPKSVQQPVTPVFSKNLKSAINAEESASLSVEATVDAGTLTYRLYKNNSPFGSDQTSGSFTVTTSGTYYIKAINTLNGSSVCQDSNKCVVTITGKPTDGTGNLGFNFGEQSKLSKIEFISGTSVKNGENLTLTVRATYEDGTSAEVFPAYSLDDTEIAVVQNGYILKGISAGTVNITATYTEDEVTKTASVKITVTDGNGGGSGSGSASGGFDFGS